MKSIIVICFAFFMFQPGVCQQTNGKDVIKPYVEFLEKQETNSVDYVFKLFDRYDIVMIVERHHSEFTQYEFVKELINDPRFVDIAGNIHTEIGICNAYDMYNDFLYKENLSEQEVHDGVINICQNNDFYPIWDRYNSYWFIREVYKLNSKLPADKKVKMCPSDIPFCWDTTHTEEQWFDYMEDPDELRDSIMGTNIVNRINLNKTDSRKKHLVIMSYRHAFMDRNINAGWFINKAFPGKVCNILLNSPSSISRHADTITVSDGAWRFVGNELPHDGKWDASFSIANKTDIGFDFKDSPFGQDSFDSMYYSNGLTCSDLFTGYIHYRNVEEHLLIDGIPGLITKSFESELMRRWQIAAENDEEKNRTLEEWIELINTKKITKYHGLESLIEQREKWIKLWNE